jgi:hypothetical protein
MNGRHARIPKHWEAVMLCITYKAYVYIITVEEADDGLWIANGQIGHFTEDGFVADFPDQSQSSDGSALTLGLALEQRIRAIIDAHG